MFGGVRGATDDGAAAAPSVGAVARGIHVRAEVTKRFPGELMKKTLVLVSSCFVLLGLSGCRANPDSLVQAQIKALDDMAEALEKNEPEAKLTEIKARMEQNNKKMEELKLSED